MSKTNNNQPTIQETNLVMQIGNFTHPIVFVEHPDRIKKQSDGSEKVITGRKYLRAAGFSIESAVAYLSAVLAAAEALNAGDGEKLAEKILGKHIEDTSECGVITTPDGGVAFSDTAYSKAQYLVRRLRSSTSLDDLRAQHVLLLQQGLALSEIREAWFAAAAGLPTDPSTGEVIGHPWTAEVWAEKCNELRDSEELNFSAQFDSFPGFTGVVLNLRDRRRDIERQMNEREAAKAAASEKRKAKKNSAPAAVATPVA